VGLWVPQGRLGLAAFGLLSPVELSLPRPKKFILIFRWFCYFAWRKMETPSGGKLL